VAEDVKFTFDRFLTEKGNPERQLLDSVDRVEVVDRYTVKFLLKEPFVWLLDILANAMMMWIVAPEFEGMAMGPYGVGWEPDSALYGPYTPDYPRNRGHVNDPKLEAMVKEQRQIKDPEARKQLIYDIQRYVAEQQYYVYLSSQVITASWQPYLKNFAPNLTFDFGSRVAVTWLDR
jgi:ABC-type transport system substrate-binding protein